LTLSGTVLRAFASKLRGQQERLIGVLHVAEHGLQAVDTPCREKTVANAAKLARYFLAHGKAAIDEVGADPVVARARRLVDHLVYHRIEAFTRREVQINKWAGCRTPEQVDGALAELVYRGYVSKKSGTVHQFLRPELFR
jgi:hypothetical protein